MKVPFVSIGKQYEALKEELLETFDSIGSSGQYVMGDILEDFEVKFAEYCEAQYALGLANVTIDTMVT